MGHRISMFLQCFESWKSISENRAEAKPHLAVVIPVTEFKCCAPNNQLFSWLVLMQVISVSCAAFQSVSEYYLFLSSYLCFVPWSVTIFWDLLLRCLVPASCHSWFVSIWALWLDVLQGFLPLALPSSPDHSLSRLFFKTNHVSPTIWLKAFSLSWGDGYICWCYLEHLAKWRELSAPGDLWHTLTNLAHS